MSTIKDLRPPFPSGWQTLDITPDELDLAHTLPVGQTFLWHRQPVPSSSPADYSKVEETPFIKQEDPSRVEQEPTEEWSRAVRDPPRVLFLRQSPTKIYYTSITTTSTASTVCADKAYLLDLFNSDITAPHGTLTDVYAAWAEQDPALFGKAWGRGEVPRGVRVLRQDPWECLISFITSSANNVPRITSLLHRLSTHFSAPLMILPAPGYALGPSSDEVPTPYITYHLFPRPLDLLQPADGTNAVEQLETTLRGLGFGYRAGFISSSLNSLISAHGTPDERAAIGVPASEVQDGEIMDTQGVEAFLHSLRRGGAKHPVSGEEDKWRGELLALKGVGRKVADCIGLMSLDRTNVVPIDTHLQQIAARHPRFPGKLKGKATSTEGVYNAVQGFLRDLWGAVAQRPEDEQKEEVQKAGREMQLAGWCQSVMFAADLKGSTAVVKVKVEVMEEVKEDTGRGMRRVKKEEVKRTASLVSEMVPQMTPSTIDTSSVEADPIPPATSTGKRKRKPTTHSGVVAKKATTKASTKSPGGGHISNIMTSVKREVKEVVKVTRGGLSGRSERYSARCDLLEVDVAGPVK